jgi:hypothetical protein|uniref:Uncharacterized protein n=1 Tax=viral metagenome TaxID=1070528 RepID=A0A6C0H126_9ZZZZ
MSFSAKNLYPEQRKKLKFIDTKFNYDNLQKDTKSGKLQKIPDTVLSTIGMYTMTKNNQESNVPVETELKYGIHDPKKLQEMVLDTGRYAPIEFNKLTDGGHVMLNAKYDKLTVLQDFDDSVKNAGQIFTFKSATRKNNLDYSEYLVPPLKTYGRGIGNFETLNDTYLGDEARTDNYNIKGFEFRREQELPIDYYVVNRDDLPFPKQGIDTRYLNYKNARSKNVIKS